MAATWCVEAGKPGPILAAGEPPETCPHCGATLALRWDVYVEATPNTPTESAVNNDPNETEET